jgi:hypothetical protein
MADKGLKSNVVGLFGGTMLGLVLILGLGLILAGLVIMAILRVRQPAFFRGETIIHESAHAMRPHEHLVA